MDEKWWRGSEIETKKLSDKRNTLRESERKEKRKIDGKKKSEMKGEKKH